MQTLIIDTSGPYTSVALAAEGRLRGYSTQKAAALTHLHPQIQALLNQLAVSMDGLERIAVVTGPGSWTGLNIGVTAAKTLAQVLDLPLVPLPTLDALVAVDLWQKGSVNAVLDGKRNHLYRATFPTAPDGGVLLERVRYDVLTFDALCAALAAQEGTPLVVEYGDVFGAKIREALPRAHLQSRPQISREGLLAALAFHESRFKRGDQIMDVSPWYLQQTLAERDWQKKPGGSSC